MTTSHLHFAVHDVNGGVALGDVTQVYSHAGLDREQQVIVRFTNACGRLAMSRSQAEKLQRELLVVLATNTSQRPDCSGAAWTGEQ
jgi:hypothetical protein